MNSENQENKQNLEKNDKQLGKSQKDNKKTNR